MTLRCKFAFLTALFASASVQAQTPPTHRLEPLVYDEALDWFGLQFVVENGEKTWQLERRDDQTALQERQLQEWLRSDP